MKLTKLVPAAHQARTFDSSRFISAQLRLECHRERASPVERVRRGLDRRPVTRGVVDAVIGECTALPILTDPVGPHLHRLCTIALYFECQRRLSSRVAIGHLAARAAEEAGATPVVAAPAAYCSAEEDDPLAKVVIVDKFLHSRLTRRRRPCHFCSLLRGRRHGWRGQGRRREGRRRGAHHARALRRPPPGV